jgi:pyruvate formate lyase activating enzyme
MVNFRTYLPIVGIEPLTTVDFPGRIAAVMFTSGCAWNCRYCHNAGLRDHQKNKLLSPIEVESFLAKRASFLEGIVVSGGEPTIHESLTSFLQTVREYGYAAALHTNGACPEMLRIILKKRLIDYIALDIKAPPREYDRVAGVCHASISVARSIGLILSSGIEYEFRTTYHPAVLSEKELLDTVMAVHKTGAKKYRIQRARKQGVQDSYLLEYSPPVTIPEVVEERARELIKDFEIR